MNGRVGETRDKCHTRACKLSMGFWLLVELSGCCCCCCCCCVVVVAGGGAAAFVSYILGEGVEHK